MNDISITPVANGFVVVLPQIENNSFEQILPAIKSMKKEMEKDSLLAELEAKNIAPASEDAESIVRAKHIFVFVRFKDVLDFLKERFSNAWAPL